MGETAVLAMYDVRGIQNYIFKTNRVKEIIGASRLVETIIEDAFLEAASTCIKDGIVISQWTECSKVQELEIIHDKNVKAQILFIGGGNAYILYQDRDICLAVNRYMSKYVLEHTYSLQLAVAVIDKSDNYYNDYKRLNQEMTRIKQSMPMTKYVGALPITQSDNITGYPLTKGEDGEKICTEVRLKLKTLETLKKEGKEKFFDSLITQKGEDSQLAIVHIDGNNLGIRIRELMEDKELGDSYEKSVQRMRTISQNIKREFENTFHDMEAYLNNWVQSDANTKLKKDGSPVYLRKIILAGDDVTFVCNANIAMSLVEYFVNSISTKLLFERENLSEEENRKRYGFSVCAGIAYIYSHFPFSTGYIVAEECCDSAKKRAKEAQYQVDGQAGNWIDFQICKSVQVGNLEKNRSDNYRIHDGSYLLRRPYYLSGKAENAQMDEQCREYDFKMFKEQMAFFSNSDLDKEKDDKKDKADKEDKEKMPRSFVKDMRNTYPYGKNEMDKLILFAKSRDRVMPDGSEEAFIQGVAKWYDALEMVDFYVDMEKGEA